MSESEAIDRLLRRSMAAESAPTLSPEFERRLANRLEPRRLRSKPRYFLLGYSFVGICLSFLAMHASGMDWRLAALAALVPIVLVSALIRPHFQRPRRR